ncbi:MAG: HDOD domain-containing protein [Kiritimatiellae bacterium]|nr:HDOD domain-containing protein [Kiritimatiellia bacterium]
MPSPKKQILFVDDEPRVMYGLRYMLHTMNREWEMEFVTGSRQALDAMAKHPYDLVVADMLMPEMYGGDLLEEVRKRWPGTVRFILSGYSNKEMIIRSLGATHQYLAKPVNADVLKAMVAQVFYLHDLLPCEPLRTLVLDMRTLPTLEKNEARLFDALNADETSTDTISEIVGGDMAMLAVMLHFVNSAFFGLRHKIENVDHALGTLGLETIRDMFLKGEVLVPFSASQAGAFPIEDLYQHSVRVSARAAKIMQTLTNEAKPVNDSIMAGLLHGIGLSVLIAGREEAYAGIYKKHLEAKQPLDSLEQEALGATHAQIGGYLLGIWGLPDELSEAVYYHLTPSLCPNATVTPLTAVHVANVLEKEKTLGRDHPAAPKLDSDYLAKLGVQKLLPQWRET